MIVATRAFQGESKKCCPEGMDTVSYIFDTKFFGDRAALNLLLMQTRECRCDPGFAGGIRQEVASNLFVDESIEGFVGIEGINDIVAKRPNSAIFVLLEAIAVGIA